PGPTEIEIMWHRPKSSTQVGRQRRGLLPIEIACLRIPFDIALGNQEQQGLRTAMRQPEIDLLVNPLRPGSSRRTQQEKELGGPEGAVDVAPQIGGREAVRFGGQGP